MKPVVKPTRSMPKIDMDQGDSMDEGEGHEEWLSDGGYTDDDTFPQDEQSILQDPPNLVTTSQGTPQIEETVENINNQLQLEINIGEDGVAVIRRQAVRVANESISPQKVTQKKEQSEPPGSPSILTAQPAAAATMTSASEGAGTGDDEENSADDPEKLLDQLETFLIRKTDGKVLETKATVQTNLNDLVKNTVDDKGDQPGDEEDDGNDTDDLLSVLDDSTSRRTTRSAAKLQQAETPNKASTHKDKTSPQTKKQVAKSLESSKTSAQARRSTTRSTSSSNSSKKDSQDEKPVILSNKVVHLSNKKSQSNQKSSQNKSDKNTNKDNKETTSKTDADLIKHFAKKNTEKELQIPLVKVDVAMAKKPFMAISNTNFGDTYTSFIQKQSTINKKLENKKSSNIKKLVESPKAYKRKASTFKEKAEKDDPFDKLLQSENESDEKSQKIKRLSIDSVGKSPATKKAHLDISESSQKLSKSNLEAYSSPKMSTISPKVSNKTSDGTNKLLSMLEKNTGLSVKSTTSPGNNKFQSITRKAVSALPSTQSPKVQTPKLQSTKIQTPKMQSPSIQTSKVQSPIIQSTKTPIRTANASPIIQKRESNVSTKLRPISPSGKKVPIKQSVINKYTNPNLNRTLTPKSYPNKTKAMDKKDLLNKNNLSKDDLVSEDEEMDSEFEDHHMHSMPEWPGSSDDEEEDEKKPLVPPPPQRDQEANSKTAEPIQEKLFDRDGIDEGSSEFDSDDMDYSDFDDMSASETESLRGDMFTIDLRDERAAEYLPLLGAKAQEMLEREKRSLLQKLTTIRQGLKSLQDNTKKNQTEVELAKLKIIELNTIIRQP